MCSSESLREFVSERLAAAAEDIFVVFRRTIEEYEEEIHRQRRLLQSVGPRADSPRTDVKEEPEELCSQEGQQLVLKQEMDTFMWTPEERDHGGPGPGSGPQTLSHQDSDRKENIKETLTAAAEDILEVFDRIIIKSTEDNERQRRLLDIVLKPRICLQKIDDTQKHECKKEEAPGEQLSNQERRSSPDQEDPEPPQVKEEPEEQETETSMWTHEEGGHSEPGPQEEGLVSHGKASSSSSASKVHMRTHRGHRSYPCRSCGKALQNRRDLRQHMKSHQSQQQQYFHETPGTPVTGMSQHTRTRPEERPYSCRICGNSFRLRSNRDHHYRVHMDEKQFTCDICTKSFTFKCNLVAHMRTHTGERPYTCSTCGQSFSQSQHLAQHMFIHAEKNMFVCQTCGRSFKLSCAMKRHMRRVHSTEKPHHCKVCGKQFYYRYERENHLKLHAEKRP